ncbi:MAG TPA: hypothetical protein VJZ69_02670 [Clostridia bacterium]|nr:hypothetical protein [Clostridia bacterium]
MNFLDKIYQSLSNLGSKFPPVDATILYVILLCGVLVLAAICGVCYLSTPCFKLGQWSKKITKYLAGISAVNLGNKDSFVAECFGNKCPKLLVLSWQLFESVNYGYPSEFVNEKSVYEKGIKSSAYPMFLFGTLAVIVIAILGIMLAGVASLNALFIGILLAFVLAAVLEVLLFVLFRVVRKKTYASFCEMQENLDAKVLFQDMKELVADTKGLSAIADEIEKMAINVQKTVLPEIDEIILDKPKVEAVEEVAVEKVEIDNSAKIIFKAKEVEKVEVQNLLVEDVPQKAEAVQNSIAENVPSINVTADIANNIVAADISATELDKTANVVEQVEETAEEVATKENPEEIAEDVTIKDQTEETAKEGVIKNAENAEDAVEQTKEIKESVEEELKANDSDSNSSINSI